MSTLELSLRLVGWSLIALAFAHLFFPARFNWRTELARLSLLNRQIFYVHCFFLCLILSLMGSLCAFAPDALLERTRLGGLLSVGLAVFWGSRLVAQWFVYDRALWRGKRFETWMHWLVTGVWVVYTAVFAWVAWWQWG